MFRNPRLLVWNQLTGSLEDERRLYKGYARLSKEGVSTSSRRTAVDQVFDCESRQGQSGERIIPRVVLR